MPERHDRSRSRQVDAELRGKVHQLLSPLCSFDSKRGRRPVSLGGVVYKEECITVADVGEERNKETRRSAKWLTRPTTAPRVILREGEPLILPPWVSRAGCVAAILVLMPFILVRLCERMWTKPTRPSPLQ